MGWNQKRGGTGRGRRRARARSVMVLRSPLTALFSVGLAWLLVWGAQAADAPRPTVQPLPLYQMVATADVIVVGTLAKVTPALLTLTTEQVIQGPAEKKYQVKRYVPDTAQGPWLSEHKDQQLMLFLSRAASGYESMYQSIWTIMGAGGQGELPIENQSIYLGGFSLPGFVQKTYPLPGGQITGYQWVRDEFFEAVAQYGRCFQMKIPAHSSPSSAPTLVQTCPDDALNTYRQSSAISRLLVEQSLAAIGPAKASAASD